MQRGLLIGLLFFNVAMGALAVTPNLGLAPDTADLLHFAVAAVDTAAFGLFFRRPFAVALVILAGCAAVELLQSAIPGREASFSDLGLDAAGVMFGLFAYAALLPTREHRWIRRHG